MRGKFVALQLYGPLLVRNKPSFTRLVLTLIVLLVVVVVVVVMMMIIMTTMRRKILCDMKMF
jgi:hypothetical protein